MFSKITKTIPVLSIKLFDIFKYQNMTIIKKSFDSFGRPILIASILGMMSLFSHVLISPQDYFYEQGENCPQSKPKTGIPEISSTVRTECMSWRWKYRGSSPIISSLSSSFISSALTIVFFEILLRKFYAEQLYRSIDNLLDKRRGEDSIKQISRFYSTVDKYHQEIWNSIEIKDKNPSDKIAKIDAIEINKIVYLLATDKLEVLQKRVRNGWKIRLMITHYDNPTIIDSIAKLERIMISEEQEIRKSGGFLEIRHCNHVPTPPFFYFNYSDNTNEKSLVKESILFSLYCVDETYCVAPGFSVTDPSMQEQFDECFSKLWKDSENNSIISIPHSTVTS